MRSNLTNSAVLASLLCGLLSVACSPGRDEPPDSPDQPQLPPMDCDDGALRCSQEKGSINECQDGKWTVKQTCDVASGQVCRGARCIGPCDDLPNGSTGCSFYPVNLWSTSTDGQLGIVASNTSTELSAEVTLSDATGVIETQTAPPQGLVVFRLDHYRNKLDETEQAQKGFHLSSTAPVAVYQFHPIDAAQVFSGSATLLLPEHVMAQNYFVVAYTYNADLITIPPQGQGVLAVVGISDNTQVQVTVPVATAAGGTIPALMPGQTLTVTLNRLEVLEVMHQNSHEDISGAIVKSSAPVAVFGGAGGVSIPTTAVGGNHLGSQMFPLTTWGKHYVGSKFKQRNATDLDHYRILASVDNTVVTFTGTGMLPPPQRLARGAFFEFDTDSDFEITADQPILALQYLVAWGDLSGTFDPSDFPDGVSPSCPFPSDSVQCLGDANMAPLAPVEQYRPDYVVYVPETYQYDFLNVVAPIGTMLTLDDLPVFDPLRPLGTGQLGRVILRVTPGNHRIRGNQPFGLMCYGYAYATSYSYPGGLNLEPINPIPPG